MLAHAGAIAFTDFFHTFSILILVSRIDHQARNLFRPAAGFRYDRDDVGQGLIELIDEIEAYDLLLLIPSDLPGDEQETAAFCQYAVRKTTRCADRIRINKSKTHF